MLSRRQFFVHPNARLSCERMPPSEQQFENWRARTRFEETGLRSVRFVISSRRSRQQPRLCSLPERQAQAKNLLLEQFIGTVLDPENRSLPSIAQPLPKRFWKANSSVMSVERSLEPIARGPASSRQRMRAPCFSMRLP